MVSDPTIDKLISLILEFHIKTGAPIEDIKALVKNVGEVTSDFTMQLVRGEINRTLGSSGDN